MDTKAEEQQHFDKLTQTRAEHGFIPDLDNMRDCDFFFLSPFRRKALANLSLRPWSEFRIQCLLRHLPRGSRVLDVGCGTGWFSLELARAGFAVTGIDFSETSIELAKKTYQDAGPASIAGSLEYIAADLECWEGPPEFFDAVSYVGLLHHIENPGLLIRRIKKALKAEHYFVCMEPLAENFGASECAFALLVRTLLAASGAWFEELPVPETASEFDVRMDDIRNEYVEWADKTERHQSPHNNASLGSDILSCIEEEYEILEKQDCITLFQRIIGGIRLGDDDKNLALAKFIRSMEEHLLQKGVLKPGAFNVFGKSK